jgi:hypothetical protein
LRCVDNFSPRVSDVEAFGASGFAHGWVSVEANDAAASATAAISGAAAATAAGGAGSDPAQNRPTD